MGIGNKILASIISISMLSGESQCSENANANPSNTEPKKVERIENIPTLEVSSVLNVQKEAKKEISICLMTDDKDSFTHTNVLEQVLDPKNTILEYPVGQLFQKYKDEPHPLRVSGVGRDFSALLGKNGIERLLPKIPQKLTSRSEEITSDTKYEVEDTLRFPLINPLLKDDFPQYLSDQLKEEGFEEFSDPNSSAVARRIENRNNQKDNYKKTDFIYDIVVKRAPSGKSALALYRDGELFMTTYASVGLPFIKTRNGYKSAKTRRGQFKVLVKDPYKRSLKYGNAPMPESLNIIDGFYIHQGYVTGNDLSHGCIRVPGVYIDIMYSLIKNIESTDVFISKNLYNPKK